MTLSKNGSKARFLRATQFGDPLPQQVRDVGGLSGRPLLILDGFSIINLEGTIPAIP